MQLQGRDPTQRPCFVCLTCADSADFCVTAGSLVHFSGRSTLLCWRIQNWKQHARSEMKAKGESSTSGEVPAVCASRTRCYWLSNDEAMSCMAAKNAGPSLCSRWGSLSTCHKLMSTLTTPSQLSGVLSRQSHEHSRTTHVHSQSVCSTPEALQLRAASG